MAVSAFHNDRNGEPPDMQSDPHEPHPLSGSVANRLPFVQRLAKLQRLRHVLPMKRKNAASDIYPCNKTGIDNACGRFFAKKYGLTPENLLKPIDKCKALLL